MLIRILSEKRIIGRDIFCWWVLLIVRKKKGNDEIWDGKVEIFIVVINC